MSSTDVVQGNSLFAQQASSPPKPKTSMTSTALIVRMAEGVILHVDHQCTPFPEQRLVNFRSLKGANSVVRARVDELAGQRRIMLETASGIPLALVDTTNAVYEAGNEPPPREMRRAEIHRVSGNSFHLMGNPCATVVSVDARTFEVLNLTGVAPKDTHTTLEYMIKGLSAGLGLNNEDKILSVQCDELGYIQEMRDPSGRVVVRQERRVSRHGDAASNLWCSQGADITLVACVALAVRKLR